MDELEAIKKRKMQDLGKRQFEKIQNRAQEQEQLQQQVHQLEMIVKQALTKEALERYGNLKTAFPEKAIQLLVILAQALQSGQIKSIDDETLKEVLRRMTPEKKEFKINKA